jgi:hypothetical protein
MGVFGMAQIAQVHDPMRNGPLVTVLVLLV